MHTLAYKISRTEFPANNFDKPPPNYVPRLVRTLEIMEIMKHHKEYIYTYVVKCIETISTKCISDENFDIGDLFCGRQTFQIG